MRQGTLMKIGEKAILVESEHYDDVFYAIDKEGRGMWLIAGDKIVAMDDPNTIADEIKAVWEHLKPGT